MGDRIRNVFKTTGVFTCHHPAHRQFDYAVSPYHLFKVAGCWPKGCVEFLWRCRQFDKGHKCPKKYKHVGRGCSSCRYYYDIKNCHTPQTKFDPKQLKEFIRDLREYEGWLESMNGKTVRFSGTIESIRPHLSMKIGPGGRHLRMGDYFVSFSNGYLGTDLFDDRLYLKITSGFLRRKELAPGDEIECDVVFAVDKGRVIFGNPRRIDLVKNGGKQTLTPSNALVGRATGKIITGSISFCEDCPYCCLIDIEDETRVKPAFYRRFYCLRGINDPEYCPVRLKLLETDNIPRKNAKRF